MNGFALNNISGAYIGSNPVSAIYLGSNKIWPTINPYETQYLTFEAINNNVKFCLASGRNDGSLIVEYSLDDGNTWNNLVCTTASPNNGYATYTPAIQTGAKILWRRTVTTPLSLTDAIGFYTIYATGDVNVYGNVMSLIYGDNFYGHKDLTEVTTYEKLFSELFYNSPIVNAENLILPATTLTKECYHKMFNRCTKLITVPKLPATTLAQNCYAFMFAGCASLTTAPKLPVTTLVRGCYEGMFSPCVSLTDAPELPAPTLADYCYWTMFTGCTNLNYIKMLATDISASRCLDYWVERVSSTGTFVKNAAMTTLPTGISGVPAGWTLQDA